MSDLDTGSTVIFEPRGECRSTSCDNCQRFFQPTPTTCGICVCGHSYAFHATLPTQVLAPPSAPAFTHAPNFDRFQTARNICLPSTQMAPPINSLYARAPTVAITPTDSPYAPLSGVLGFPYSSTVSESPTLGFPVGPTVDGVEASLGSGTPYTRRIREMASRSGRGRGRTSSSIFPPRSPPVREFRATFTYLRRPYDRIIPNGMSADHKRLESRGLCNIPVAFNLDRDTSADAVQRIITDALVARRLGPRAGDWKLWRISGVRGVGSLQPLENNVVLDLETLQYCCRINHKNNFYVTPKYDLFTLTELHGLAEWYTNYTSRAESARLWAGWQEIDRRERQEFLQVVQDVQDVQDNDTSLPSEADEAGPSVRRTRSRAQMEDESEYEETEIPPRRRRRINTRTTSYGYRPRGRPPRGAAPTIRVPEEPDSPPILAEFPINIPESPPPESPASPTPSLSITEPATPEAGSDDYTPSRRSQLADPGSDIERFEGVILKMSELHGPKTNVREEERITWLFGRNPHTWLGTLFDFIGETPWDVRIGNPHPRVKVDHPHYRRGIDCGGVFKTFIHTNIREFVDGEDFVNGGFLGRTFRKDYESTHLLGLESTHLLGLEPPPSPHFRKYELFGKLMASYIFCHRDFPWPRGLDPVIFLVAYFRFKGERYAPHSSRVGGPVGQAMKVLEEWGEGLPVAPQVLYDVITVVGWSQTTVQQNLQTPDGVETMRTALYWVTHWAMRVRGLDAFIRGLNERNLFQTMVEDGNLQLEDIDSWLLQSGIPSAQSVRAILSFSSGSHSGDSGSGFREKYVRVRNLLENWIDWSDRVEGSLDNLDWLVKEVFGTSFVGNTMIEVVITTRVGGDGSGEGLMQFSTCINQLKLSTKLLEEYGTSESFAQLMEMQRVSCIGGVEFSNS